MKKYVKFVFYIVLMLLTIICYCANYNNGDLVGTFVQAFLTGCLFMIAALRIVDGEE